MQLCFATAEEKSSRLAGDQLIASPMIVTTHAITVNAAPGLVWPWVVQIGQNRAGFYSYTLLENLMGCRMKNADRVHSEWQSLSVDDHVELHPKFRPLIVNEVVPQERLVLRQKHPLHWTWSFILKPQASSTRLIVRSTVARTGLLTTAVVYPVMTIGHYVMERRMLIGIRQRAENFARTMIAEGSSAES